MKNKNHDTIGMMSVSFMVPLSLGILIASFALVSAYVFFPDYRDILKFSATTAGGAAGLYAAFYVAQTLRWTLHRDRLQKSFQAIEFLDSSEMSKVRRFINKNIIQDKVPRAVEYTKIIQDEELLNSIRVTLGTYETISIGIQEHYLDEEIMYKNLAGIIPWVFKSFEEYITKTREEKGENVLYCEIEKLANSWGANKYLTSGKPLPELTGKY